MTTGIMKLKISFNTAQDKDRGNFTRTQKLLHCVSWRYSLANLHWTTGSINKVKNTYFHHLAISLE